MKKSISLLAILCFMILVFSSAVHAAESFELLPIDVINYPDRLEIRKIYEIAASENLKNIPNSDFERDGILYKCTDMLHKVIKNEEKKTVTETEIISSVKNDIETILRLLPPTKDFVGEDGFSGILYLNTSTIKSDISGYGSTSSTVSVTRSYSNLSGEDSQYIPKAITENGITYTLQDIQWQTDNTYNVDDYEIGNRYTAVVNYTGTKTSSYIKGYTITADYTGEVCRIDTSRIRYTIIFSGTEIEKPEPITKAATEPETNLTTEPETEPASELETKSDSNVESTIEPISETDPEEKSGFNWLPVVILLIFLVVAGIAIVVYMYLQKRKENTNYEETIDDEETSDDEEISDDVTGDYIDDGNGDSGDGGGV